MNELLGAYVSVSSLENEIFLTYWPDRFALQWSQCGKIPDLVATYLASMGKQGRHWAGAHVKALVGYLLNELVENSVKFYLSGAIQVRVGVDGDELILDVCNQIAAEDQNKLFKQFSELLQSDADELFLARVEGNESRGVREESSLGLISMIVDYHVQLGWRFASVTDNQDRINLHTMVRVPPQVFEQATPGT